MVKSTHLKYLPHDIILPLDHPTCQKLQENLDLQVSAYSNKARENPQANAAEQLQEQDRKEIVHEIFKQIELGYERFELRTKE